MKTYLMPDPVRYQRMTTEELRENFLLENLFSPGQTVLAYLDLDRTVVGSVVPTSSPLTLGTDDALRAAYFTERREVGLLNIGGKGTVTAGGKAFELENLDCLYIGRGTKDISLASSDASKPAQYYLVSYPAHTTLPTALAKRSQA